MALAAPVPADALRATWLGHSTMLLETDGRRILTDPVWSERVSPSQPLGPKPFFSPPLLLPAPGLRVPAGPLNSGWWKC